MFDPWLLLFVQVLCFAGGLLVVARCHPDRQLRISDPYVLVMFWVGLYVLYPSVAWCGGQSIPYARSLSAERAGRVFFLHVLFLVGLLVGYLALQRRERRSRWRPQSADLPSGWPLFLLALLFPLASALVRVATGGPFLPQRTYGEEWIEGSYQLDTAQSRGGLGYLTTQVLSRTEFYVGLLQGIGGGLILSRAVVVRRGVVRAAAALAGGVLILLLLNNMPRNVALIPLLISLVFADFLVGP